MAAADPNGPCDYSTGHGFVFFSPNVDSDCDSFVIYHLGELECPHQYIVAAEVTVQKNVRDLYCNKFKSGNETVFVVAPEFILPQFFGGQIPSFTSQFFQGFFTTVLLDSIAVNVVNIIYGQMINVVQPGSLAYYLYEDSKGHQFMSHVISTAPDFDHLILVEVGGTPIKNTNTGRKGPVLVQFSPANTFANRLQEGKEYEGTVYEVNQKGQMEARPISVWTHQNIYPGPNKLNGDGQTDFQQFCVEPSRPMWDSCRVFGKF